MRTITKQNIFEELQTAKPVLLEFWAPWCVYCRRLGPVLESLENDYGDRISVCKVNVDEQPEIAYRYHIENLPSLLLFRDGEPKKLLVAPQSKPEIDEWLKESL